MKTKTTTIRIDEELREKLEQAKGEDLSHNKFIAYLLEFFLTKK